MQFNDKTLGYHTHGLMNLHTCILLGSYIKCFLLLKKSKTILERRHEITNLILLLSLWNSITPRGHISLELLKLFVKYMKLRHNKIIHKVPQTWYKNGQFQHKVDLKVVIGVTSIENMIVKLVWDHVCVSHEVDTLIQRIFVSNIFNMCECEQKCVCVCGKF